MQPEVTDINETLMQFLYRAPIGLVQTTLDGTIEMINPMSAALLMPVSRSGGLDNLFDALQEVAPQLRDLVAAFPQPLGPICEALRIPLDSGGTDATLQVLSLSLMKLDAGRLMAVLLDVTLEVEREQTAMARQLDAAARVDALTRMPNRTAVLEQLAQGMTRARTDTGDQFAVLFMNCDRLKQINDTLGHAAGDEVLSRMADRLRTTLRGRDQVGRAAGGAKLAARVGGDEFVIVLDDLRRPDDVHIVAQRLLGVLAKPYEIGGRQLHCSVSMGIVLRDQMEGDADAVLRDASIAMVEAKRAGGARYVVFEPAMQERAARRGSIEVDLRRALEKRELFVVYQPVVGLGGAAPDRCAGVEALVRWRHPERGIVPLGEFIGVAEECGLIGAVGGFVLETACGQFVEWLGRLGNRAPRTLAVNLSRAQLGDPDLAAQVARILRTTGMRAAQLQLEVTESLAAQDASVQARLHELKALGMTLAQDDFGTGYSSLACLHQLPVDTVKIDRSFVSQVDTSGHHRVLIDATIKVARSLGMSTVAEGIETASQAAAIQALGCDKGQGYGFAKPLPASELVFRVTATTTSPAYKAGTG
jgi:diguanylate cyclase (GGDEF)-like protein